MKITVEMDEQTFDKFRKFKEDNRVFSKLWELRADLSYAAKENSEYPTIRKRFLREAENVRKIIEILEDKE